MESENLSERHLEWIQSRIDRVPYAKLIGIEVEKIESGVATLTLTVRPELKQNHEVVHGGAIASLIDTSTAIAIMSILPEEERATTVDLTVNFLKPLTEGKARSTARVVRAGRRLIVVSAEVFNDAQALIATALSTYIKI